MVREFRVPALGAETSKEKFDALVDQEPVSVTLALAFAPTGMLLALFGRKHSHKFMVVLAFVLGVGATIVLVDALAHAFPVLPDGDVLNRYVPLGVGVILALMVNAYVSMFYAACALGLGLGAGMALNEIFITALSREGVPGYADTVILVVSALLGLIFLRSTVSTAIGTVYAIAGAGMIASSLSLLFYPLGGEPELWPGPLNLDGGNVPLKDGSIDWTDKYTLISIGVALVFLFIGLRGSGGSKSRGGAPTESSPLLGDPEQGKTK